MSWRWIKAHLHLFNDGEVAGAHGQIECRLTPHKLHRRVGRLEWNLVESIALLVVVVGDHRLKPRIVRVARVIDVSLRRRE